MLSSFFSLLKRSSLVVHSLIVLGSFWTVTVVAMGINPQSFWKFIKVPTEVPLTTSSLSYYWDIQAYAQLALEPECSAFYPLWPTLIRLGLHPTTIVEAAQDFLQVATLLSILSVPFVLALFRQAFQSERLALGIALLYSLSPLAIFRVIGYTESLFSFLGILLLLLIQQVPSPRLAPWIVLGVGVLSAFLALLRPTLPQMIGSSIGALVTLIGLAWATHHGVTQDLPAHDRQTDNLSFQQVFQQRHPLVIPTTIALILGTIVGYSFYGSFCWSTTNDFFAPFSQQSFWNKSLGFRPWLLFTSRSPLLDLWSLYLPPLLWVSALGQVGQALGYLKLPFLRGGLGGWILAFYPPLWILLQTWGRSMKQLFFWETPHPSTPLPPWGTDYSFWFALYFSISHGVICFLTQDRLVSLGRYIFAQPFVFVALGCLYPHLDHRHQRFLWPMLLGLSSLYLLDQWIRYGYHQWLG